MIFELNSDFQSATEDSGWITITPSGKFANYESEICRYRKIGKMVQVIGQVTPTEVIPGSSEWTTIFNLPSGFRPVSDVDIVCNGTGINRWLFSVRANGDCRFSRYSTSEYVDVNPGNWLPFSATFFAV